MDAERAAWNALMVSIAEETVRATVNPTGPTDFAGPAAIGGFVYAIALERQLPGALERLAASISEGETIDLVEMCQRSSTMRALLKAMKEVAHD